MEEEVLMLIKHDFDTLENRDANCSKIVGVFLPDKDKKLTAHGVASAWIENMTPSSIYLGWDGNVYPRFEIKAVDQLKTPEQKD